MSRSTLVVRFSDKFDLSTQPVIASIGDVPLTVTSVNANLREVLMNLPSDVA